MTNPLHEYFKRQYHCERCFGGYLFTDAIWADIYLDENPQTVKTVYIEDIGGMAIRVFLGYGGNQVMPKTSGQWLEVSHKILASLTDENIIACASNH